MKIIRHTFFMALLLLVSNYSVQAQKFGYINAEEVLADMPEVKVASRMITSYEKELREDYQLKIQAYQTDMEAVVKKINSGQLSPEMQASETDRIYEKQDELAQEEQLIAGKIEEKNQELQQPIFDKVNAAIEAVAKENGLEFILSESVLLYGSERIDMTRQVKSKLGLL